MVRLADARFWPLPAFSHRLPWSMAQSSPSAASIDVAPLSIVRAATQSPLRSNQANNSSTAIPNIGISSQVEMPRVCGRPILP